LLFGLIWWKPEEVITETNIFYLPDVVDLSRPSKQKWEKAGICGC
jgi:hypothetical protein